MPQAGRAPPHDGEAATRRLEPEGYRPGLDAGLGGGDRLVASRRQSASPTPPYAPTTTNDCAMGCLTTLDTGPQNAT